MNITFLDFETYYDTDYSLRKISPAEYILDPRFECTGLAVKRNNDPSFWVEGDQVEEFFRNEPTDVMSVSHNALFDASICTWRYGWTPKLIVDTLGIARATVQHQLRNISLAAVAKHLGLGEKGTALVNVKGMRLEQIRANPKLHREHIEYGLNDVDLCAGIFDVLVRGGQFPINELVTMDMVLRCAINPKFIVDVGMLNQALTDIQTKKEEMLAKAMLMGADGKADLMSNDRFADLLRSVGVEPPKKISPTTGKVAYAFAKTDQDFLDLQEHPDVAVQTLVAARLGHKSTIEETRTQRFINIGNLEWPGKGYAKLMPMPLRYAGAHTHRLSGDWKMNVQNMGRGSLLRQSLVAPPGYKVVAGDESQIEARMNVTISGQEDMRLAFEQGRDVYSEFASELFGYPVGKTEKTERFVGKQCILGLGYNLGWNKFGRSIPILSYHQIGTRIDMPDEEAQRVVKFYRDKNYKIVHSWRILQNQGIRSLMTGDGFWFGPVEFQREAIVLPEAYLGAGKLKLFYHNIRRVNSDGKDEVMHSYGGMPKRTYGGLLLENIVQALARLVVMDAASRIRARLAQYNVELALQVHDELVFVVPDELVELVKGVMYEELRRRPWWMPNLPLDCEIGVGQNYGDAK